MGDEIVLMKVVRNGKTSIKIVSAKSQLSKLAENGPKMVSNDEMVLMKVVRNGKTSLNIISAKSQLSKIAENGLKMAFLLKFAKSHLDNRVYKLTTVISKGLTVALSSIAPCNGLN